VDYAQRSLRGSEGSERAIGAIRQQHKVIVSQRDVTEKYQIEQKMVIEPGPGKDGLA